MKAIIGRIKTHYFNFLSSLKFQNIHDKKSEKDYSRIDMKEEAADIEALPDNHQLESIKNSSLNFEDEMSI